MMKRALLTALLSFILTAHADGNRPVVPADLERIEQLQRQVDKLAFGPLGNNSYTLSKARAWLDMALIEYHQQDRTGIVQDAAAQAASLLTALDANPAFISLDTPHPYASEKIRTDLWDKADALKKHLNLACAGRKIAELEVQLVWTGHYKWESGWNQAEPYARIAENLAYEAQTASGSNSCAAVAELPAPVIAELAAPAVAESPAPAVAELPAPAVAKLAAPAVAALPEPAAAGLLPPTASKPASLIERRTLNVGLLFAYAKSGLSDSYIKNSDNQNLNKILAELQSWNTLKRIQITGHADRLGKKTNITRLATERAENVKSYLVSHGIDASLIETRGLGASQPVVQCSEQRDLSAMMKCLQPNRRIEMIIEGVRK